MFQELMCARQAEQESPQQFLYRMIGLKQRLLFQSKQASTDISYDPKTIQEVFLNTVYQGLGAKHTDLRQRLRPLVSNNQVTDEEILGQMTKMISDENEHQRRLGQLPRQKSSHAHSAKVETDGQSNDKSRGSAADDKNLQTIQQLSAQVETLTQMVATLMCRQVSSNQMGHSLPPLTQIQPQTTSYRHFHSTSNHTPPLPQPVCPSSHPSSQHLFQPSPNADPQSSFQARRRIVRCSKCTEEDQQECNHCFACGEAGHQAVGCVKRTRFQGNEIRSLSRDRQRPVHSPQSQPVSSGPKHPLHLSKAPKPQPTQTLTCQSDISYQAPLIGKRSQLKCLINGHPATVLFDTGSQVSIIDRVWASTHIPS